jgi:hypothetical protein
MQLAKYSVVHNSAVVEGTLTVDSKKGHIEARLLASKKTKTYNSGYSLVVTHLTTNPPVRCLNRAERTGSLVFNVLWSYVSDRPECTVYILMEI